MRKEKVYILTPAWIIKNKKEHVRGIKTLEGLGFEVINKDFPTKNLTIEQKVHQLHQAFLDKDVDIVLAQRGGYGCIKLLPYIDFNIIKNNIKKFCGFSDISVLLNVIFGETKIITYHSPMLINFADPTKFTINSFLNAISGFPVKNIFKNAKVKALQHGKAEGILKGGNTVTLTSLLGTKWEIDTKDAILFLEEVDEELYRVDRALTQWILAGKLNNIKGLILGNFRKLKIKDVYRVLKEQIKIDFPVVYCPYIGHLKNKITLPVGAKVRLNTYKDILEVLI
jgi:muramoyltetrapeptide carboxypeptidase